MKELEFFKLEDRVLFEAAAAVEIVDAVEEIQNDPNANVSESERQEQEERDVLKNALLENPADTAHVPENIEPSDISDINAEIDALVNGEIPGSAAAEKELVVINGSVADKDAVISSLNPNQDYVILQDGNGLAELNSFLDKSDVKYSAIHMVTHGNEGYISVNGEIINADNFDASAWQQIGEHLTDDGDIMLYGCSTAGNAAGQQLVDMIADASGADAAASDDVTGVSGNWQLEYSAGEIETNELEVADFKHNLTNYNVDTESDIVDDTDGVTSLREAVLAANGNAGADEITFDSSVDGKIIVLDNGAIEITESLTIAGNGINETVIDGNRSSSIFYINVDGTQTYNISGLTLQNGNSADYGGAINVDWASSDDIDVALNLSDVSITDCSAYNGGAIGVYGWYSNSENISLGLENVSITGCSAEDGGAIYINSFGTVKLDIVNTTLTGNSVGYGDGSAVYVWSDSFTANVVNSTITGNTSESINDPYIGALYFQHYSQSELNVINSIIYGNTNNGTAADIYVNDPTAADVNVVYSIYGEICDGNAGDTLTPETTAGSTYLEYSNDNTQKIFGTSSPTVSDGVIEVNNKDIAGYSGTLAASDGADGVIYFDNGTWKDVSGNAVSAPADSDIIALDQNGNTRVAAQKYLGVNEFFIGAAAGQVYLNAVPGSAEHKYDGSVKTAAVKYYTAKGTEVSSANINTTGITTSSANAGTYTLNSVAVSVVDAVDGDVSNSFDFDINQTAIITITPRNVTLTSATDSKIYDGTPLTNHTITVSGDGFADGEGATYNVTGSQTNVGTSSNTFTYTLDAGTLADNYVITTVEGTLTVGSKDITVVFVTNEPYYYSSTDQSNTVSAYYVDVNGNKVDLEIDWNGKVFAAVGTYEISVTVTDGNYNALNTTKILVMLPNDPGAGIGGAGSPDGPGGGLQPIQTEVILGGGSSENVYTMRYSKLISATLKEGISIADSPGDTVLYYGKNLYGKSGVVKVDTLTHTPMTIDMITREKSMIDHEETINPLGLITGSELFTLPTEEVVDVHSQNPHPVPRAESLYIDGEHMSDVVPWTAAPQDNHFNSDVAMMESLLESDIMIADDVPGKGEMFRSDFEKVLEEIIKG